jgi:hypothetical protein
MQKKGGGAQRDPPHHWTSRGTSGVSAEGQGADSGLTVGCARTATLPCGLFASTKREDWTSHGGDHEVIHLSAWAFSRFQLFTQRVKKALSENPHE